MRDSIGVDALANWVSMLRVDINGAIILVDDDNEARFYEVCQHNGARVIPSAGVAKSLLLLVEKRGIAGVVAILQRDDNDPIISDSIFHPDIGDAASLMLMAESSKRVVRNIGGENWVKACHKKNGIGIVDQCILISWILNKLSLNFSVPFQKLIDEVIDWREFSIDPSLVDAQYGLDGKKYFFEIFQYSKDRTSKDLLKDYDGIVVMEILPIVFLKYFPLGIKSKNDSNYSDVLDKFLIAYQPEELEADDIFWDVRQWERRNREFPVLLRWRTLDPLNMLLDQRYWENDLKKMIENYSKVKTLIAIKLDLDNFKLVNTKLGHSGGDEAIRVACAALRHCIEDVAELYRRGGDELVALAPGLESDTAILLCEKIRERIEQKMVVFGSEHGLLTFPTASIGLVEVGPGADFRTVVDLMDIAQNRAKENGKNCVVYEFCP